MKKLRVVSSAWAAWSSGAEVALVGANFASGGPAQLQWVELPQCPDSQARW